MNLSEALRKKETENFSFLGLRNKLSHRGGILSFVSIFLETFEKTHRELVSSIVFSYDIRIGNRSVLNFYYRNPFAASSNYFIARLPIYL